MVRENHKILREMSGKSQGILWGLIAGHPEYSPPFKKIIHPGNFGSLPSLMIS